jgi:hypothetical protein
MTDDAEPIAKPFRLHLAATVVVAGLLWLADGRLWPSVAAYGSDGLWLFLLLQMALGGWLQKSWPGRIVAVPLNGAYLWLAAEWITGAFADGGGRRSFVLIGGGLVLALIAGNVAWERFPSAWRARLAARLAASRTARVGVFCLLSVLATGLLWYIVGAAVEGMDPRARGSLTALLLAMTGGLVLALWRLSGWLRIFTCGAIAGLVWAGLMTGLATGVDPGAIGVGGWLLAIVPPLIAAAVIMAYYRINKRYRV